MRFKSFVIVCVAVFAGGCAGGAPLRSTADLTVLPALTSLPAPARADLVAADRPALIGPLDTVEVEVVNLPDSSTLR